MAHEEPSACAEWESFTEDAAQTIRARHSLEESTAFVLDQPWNETGHARLRTSLDDIQAALPAARRLAALRAMPRVAR